MSDNIPQDDAAGTVRLALLAITFALLAVPFVGLALDAPLWWYPASLILFWRVSKLW